MKCGQFQAEEDENVPDWLADVAVVLWVRVPATVAVVPDAVFVKLKLADPAPPLTRLSSVSLSSMMISICILHYHLNTHTRGDDTSLANKAFGLFALTSSSL
jgi:hypothetical protein